MQNSVVMFTFSDFDPFWVNFVQKSKLSVYFEIWYLNYFEYAEFNGIVHLFCFRLEVPFLGKFGPKNQNCQFVMKLGTWTNSNM